MAVVEHAALSDVGRERDGNEDSYLELPPLFVVADGMGGAQAGEVASRILVATLAAAHETGTLPGGLAGAIEEANGRIHARGQEDAALAGMGTTATAIWIEDGRLLVAHVGDSRLYRLRGGALEQLTHDHSLVANLVRMGQLTPAEAEHHPQRSVILRAVGVASHVEVDATEHDVEGGDVYLLCSDGLTGMVHDEVIAEALRECDSLREAAELLIALANESGGHDNITAVLLRAADS